MGLTTMHGSGTSSDLVQIAADPGPLRGTAAVPGDKSISHRALILGALAVGETRITGLLEAEDVLNTADGDARVRRRRRARRRRARGACGAWASAAGPSRTMCSISAIPAPARAWSWARWRRRRSRAVFTGDASLRRRPMERVLEPLTLFGADYTAREGGLMPLTLTGARQPICVEHRRRRSRRRR